MRIFTVLDGLRCRRSLRFTTLLLSLPARIALRRQRSEMCRFAAEKATCGEFDVLCPLKAEVNKMNFTRNYEARNENHFLSDLLHFVRS